MSSRSSTRIRPRRWTITSVWYRRVSFRLRLRRTKTSSRRTILRTWRLSSFRTWCCHRGTANRTRTGATTAATSSTPPRTTCCKPAARRTPPPLASNKPFRSPSCYKGWSTTSRRNYLSLTSSPRSTRATRRGCSWRAGLNRGASRS